MTTIIKSDEKYMGGELATGFAAYKSRVLGDGGQITSENELKKALMYCRANNLGVREVLSAVSPNWGVKMSGGNVVKMYSLFDASGDVIATGDYPLVDHEGRKAISLNASSASKMVTGLMDLRSDNYAAMLEYEEEGGVDFSVNRFLFNSAINYGGSTGYLSRVALLSTPALSFAYNNVFDSLDVSAPRDKSLRKTAIYHKSGTLTGLDTKSGVSSATVVAAGTGMITHYVGGRADSRDSLRGYLFESWVLQDASLNSVRTLVGV